MQTGKVTPIILSTGAMIGTQRVSPMLSMEASKLLPEPQPPAVRVMIGDQERFEPNTADPSYLESRRVWQVKIQELSTKLIIMRGTVVSLTEEQKKEVADLRDFWKNEMGAELKGSDEFIYVLHIAVGSDTDLSLLVSSITGQSMPTQEAIERAEATFPSNVSGA